MIIIIINTHTASSGGHSPPPQDLLANTGTPSIAAQLLFLQLKIAPGGIEVSTCAEKLQTVISGFRRGVNEIRALLGFYAA
jgi:hypothetical protein